jgi:hypothetical protein
VNATNEPQISPELPPFDERSEGESAVSVETSAPPSQEAVAHPTQSPPTLPESLMALGLMAIVAFSCWRLYGELIARMLIYLRQFWIGV